MPYRPSVRLALGYQALTFVLVGVWAQFAPRSFYEDFPGLGRAWVRLDGPFNEHLVRDVGGLNLGLGLATVLAMLAPGLTLARGVALAALVYGLPHLVYHLSHLGDLPTPADRAGNLVLLGLGVLVPLAVLVSTVTGQRSQTRRVRNW